MPSCSLERDMHSDGQAHWLPVWLSLLRQVRGNGLRRGAHACIELCAGEATFGQGDQVEHVVALVQHDPLPAGALQYARAAQFFQGSGCGLGRHIVNPANARRGEYRG